jgi:hypothetical protein
MFRAECLNIPGVTKKLKIDFIFPEHLYESMKLLLPIMEEKELVQEAILAFQQQLHLNPWEYYFACFEKLSEDKKNALNVLAVAYGKENLNLLSEMFALVDKSIQVKFLPEYQV